MRYFYLKSIQIPKCDIFLIENLVLVQLFSSNRDKKDVSYDYAYDKHHYEEPLRAEESLTETTFHEQLAYHEVYEEQESPKLEWVINLRHILILMPLLFIVSFKKIQNIYSPQL